MTWYPVGEYSIVLRIDNETGIRVGKFSVVNQFMNLGGQEVTLVPLPVHGTLAGTSATTRYRS